MVTKDGESKRETKPAPKADQFGLALRTPAEGLQSQNWALGSHKRPTGRAGLSTCIQSVACVVGEEEVNTG